MKYGLTAKALVIMSLGVGMMQAPAYAAESQEALPTSLDLTPPQSPSEINKIMGEDFLQKNKVKPGVITLPDGLQYRIIKEGEGERPTDTDTVTVDYSGTLPNGTVFDSSYQRGEPAVFPVNGVIPGWTEALKLMKVGSVWKLYIPSHLAYGEQGAPPSIGPNQTLVFKVHLISINKGST